MRGLRVCFSPIREEASGELAAGLQAKQKRLAGPVGRCEPLISLVHGDAYVQRFIFWLV